MARLRSMRTTILIMAMVTTVTTHMNLTTMPGMGTTIMLLKAMVIMTTMVMTTMERRTVILMEQIMATDMVDMASTTTSVVCTMIIMGSQMVTIRPR